VKSTEAVIELDSEFINDPTVPRLIVCVSKNLKSAGEELKALPDEVKQAPKSTKEMLSVVIHSFGSVLRKSDVLCTNVLKVYTALDGALDAVKYARRAKQSGAKDSLLHFAQMFESSLNSLAEMSWQDFAPILEDLKSLGSHIVALQTAAADSTGVKARVWKFVGLTRGCIEFLRIAITLVAQSCGITLVPPVTTTATTEQVAAAAGAGAAISPTTATSTVTLTAGTTAPPTMTAVISKGYWSSSTTLTIVSPDVATLRVRCSEIEAVVRRTFSATPQSMIMAMKQERKTAGSTDPVENLSSFLTPELRDKVEAAVAEVAKLREANDKLRAATREYSDLFSRDFVSAYLG